MSYAEFVVPLTKAVQELDEIHQTNKSTISKNEKKLAKYKVVTIRLQERIAFLKAQKKAKKSSLISSIIR